MRRILRRWRWIVGAAGLLLVVGVLTGWLMFQHIPAWYRPIQIPPADLQRVRDDLERTADSFAEALNENQGTFKFRLTQDQLNAWLSAREAIDPKTREWLPASVSDPMVVLESDGVRLGATYTDGGLHTVISAKLAIEAAVEGIKVRLEGVSGGSLGLPNSVISAGLKAVDQHVSPQLSDAGVTEPGRKRAKIGRLSEGMLLPNMAKWPGGHRFRLVGAEFESGAVTLTVERLARQMPER